MTSLAERIEKLLKGEGLCRKWLHQESRWCHQKQTEVRSIGGELIGMICRVGHVQGIGSHRRVKKCRGCGSRIADRHALGCRTHLDDLEVAWTLANSIARFDRDDDDQLFALQELMELRIIPFLDFGGDHGG